MRFHFLTQVTLIGLLMLAFGLQSANLMPGHCHEMQTTQSMPSAHADMSSHQMQSHQMDSHSSEHSCCDQSCSCDDGACHLPSLLTRCETLDVFIPWSERIASTQPGLVLTSLSSLYKPPIIA